MRIIVGYLATPSGEDELSLGVVLARSLGAAIDICLVIHHEHTVPAAREWLAEAQQAVPDDIEMQTHLCYHRSSAQGLLDEATRLDARAIVVGGADHPILGRHSLGTVDNELLHSSHVPVVLAPRGIRHSEVTRVRELTCAIGIQPGADELLQTAVRTCQRTHAPLRLVSLVSLAHPLFALRGANIHANEAARKHAQESLEAARSVVPPEVPVTTRVAEGATVESAITSLEWQDGDMFMVGSSRLGLPPRLFLGLSAAKMLSVVPVPLVVVPYQEPVESE
jgi:nucleotide-binding universal stress UspA family protein